MNSWRIEVGDCRDVLRSMPAQSVHTVVTSPPYFGLRDYGTEGQIGLEPTPDEFVAALVDVFRGVRRVLRDDGTVWLNLGDSYAATSSYQAPRTMHSEQGWKQAYRPGDVPGEGGDQAGARNRNGVAVPRTPDGAKPKDLLGIPWMVAFALRADGWYLRSDIVWSKPNPMPESVTDRPTKSHEMVFLLSKGPRYFYDADAIREPHLDASIARAAKPWNGDGQRDYPGQAQLRDRGEAMDTCHPAGRNKRSVWTVATQPYAGAHFATFPPKLIEPCILAGAPERACGECGAPWVRVVERTSEATQPGNGKAGVDGWQRNDMGHGRAGMFESTSRTLGFEPSCSHGDGSARGVVLDPFAGAGTTGLVALRHNRDFIGIELNPEYARMARERIVADAPLLNSAGEMVA